MCQYTFILDTHQQRILKGTIQSTAVVDTYWAQVSSFIWTSRFTYIPCALLVCIISIVHQGLRLTAAFDSCFRPFPSSEDRGWSSRREVRIKNFLLNFLWDKLNNSIAVFPLISGEPHIGITNLAKRWLDPHSTTTSITSSIIFLSRLPETLRLLDWNFASKSWG